MGVHASVSGNDYRGLLPDGVHLAGEAEDNLVEKVANLWFYFRGTFDTKYPVLDISSKMWTNR